MIGVADEFSALGRVAGAQAYTILAADVCGFLLASSVYFSPP
jgi:hypothetical protein